MYPGSTDNLSSVSISKHRGKLGEHLLHWCLVLQVCMEAVPFPRQRFLSCIYSEGSARTSRTADREISQLSACPCQLKRVRTLDEWLSPLP